MKYLINIKSLVLTGFLMLTISINAQDFSKITQHLKTGNVEEFIAHFDDNLELTILDNEAIYSKTQIESILNDFFSKNEPTEYKMIHKGNSGNGAFFQIGELSTTKSEYRTYLYAKNINGKFLIQEFRIEEN